MSAECKTHSFETTKVHQRQNGHVQVTKENYGDLNT